MTNTSATRAQVGIGTLVVFLSMVLVASIAAGVLINTVGFQAGGASEPDGAHGPTDRVLVIAQTGTAVEDGSVGAVNLTVTTAPDSAAVDLRDATVSWVGPDGAYNVAHSQAGGSSDGEFVVTAVNDPNDSVPVLDSADDRMVLTFDLGETDDVAGVEEFGSRLGPGDMVSVTVTTGDGASTTTRLAVPRSPAGDGPLVL